MRLLLVASVFPPWVGGSAEVYHNVCLQLRGDAMVLTARRNYVSGLPLEGWKSFDASQPFAVHRLDRLRPAPQYKPRSLPQKVWDYFAGVVPVRWKVRREVRHLLRAFSPDVVCLGELHSLAWLASELKRAGRTVVQVIHGEEVTTFMPSRRMRAEAARALREVDGIIAVSSFTKAALEAMGVDSSRIHIAPNGVDCQRFTPGPKPADLVAKHSLEGCRVLLTISRVEEKKGHDTVIRALPRIRAAAPDVVYLIVGGGGHESSLRALVNELGLSDVVRFAGQVPADRLCDYYRLADVFLMPNRALADGDTEGFGLVFLEAGAVAKPVIGGVDGGVGDAIRNGETGFQVDGRSVSAVAEAAVRLLLDPTLAQRMGQAGREFALCHTWSHQSEAFVDACRAAIERTATSLSMR